MLKLILQLLWHRAPLQQWQLQLGGRLIEKGAGVKLGQILEERKLNHANKRLFKCKIIEGLTYDFGTREILHRTVTKVIDADAKPTTGENLTPKKTKRKRRK